jgi:PTS system beta-glucosides-specific IIC component
VLTTVNAISDENPGSFRGQLIGVLATIIITIVLVQIIGCDEKEPEVANETPATTTSTPDAKATGEKEVTIYSPLNGEVKALSEVNDPTFAGGILGQGVAIVPSEGKLYAPIDGTVSSVFDTRHAIGLEDENGTEMLIHIGLETVNLGGKHFTAKVNSGDTIKKGDVLIEFDLEAIAKEYDTITPVLIVNADDFSDISAIKTSGTVKAGQPVVVARK